MNAPSAALFCTAEQAGVRMGGIMEDQHDASGLLYRRNRYYDPATGRFTQEDPIGLAGGLNVYGYANGDPVSFSDPFGLRPLTRRERRRLGDFCERIDCDRVNVYDGRGSKAENRQRDLILAASNNRSFTAGYNIYLADQDRGDIAVLAHEMTHVWQYESWGAAPYYWKGAGERVQELRGRDPYRLPDLSRSVLGFLEYGMEQQAQIVELCFRGSKDHCVLGLFNPRVRR